MNQRAAEAAVPGAGTWPWPDYVTIQVEPLPAAASTAATATSDYSADAGLHERVAWWEERIAGPYLAATGDPSWEPLSGTAEAFGEQVKVELRVGEDLLADMLEAYAAYGWDVIEDALINGLDRVDEPTRGFVIATRLTAASCVAEGLLGLERKVSAYARQRWAAARDTVASYVQPFHPPAGADGQAALRDRDQARRLLEACREFDLRRRSAVYLQDKDIRFRARDAKLAARYARNLQRQLAYMHPSYRAAIAALPSVALIIDSLPGSVTTPYRGYDPNQASSDLEHAVYTRLGELDADLIELTASLDKTQEEPNLAALAELSRSGGETSGRSRRRRPPLLPGLSPDGVLVDVALGSGERTSFHVMGHLDLLSELARDPSAAGLSAWQQLVLQRYVRRLAARIEADQRWNDEVRQWLNVISAALGILATVALVLTTFGVGTAAVPALAGALALIGQVNAMLAVALLIYSVIDTLQSANAIDEHARQQLFRLTEAGADDLQTLGNVIARSRAAYGELAAQVLLQLVLALAASAKAIAVALEAYSFAADVATISALFE